MWGKCPQLPTLGRAADCNGVFAIARVDRYEKGKELRVPYMEGVWGKLDFGKGTDQDVPHFMIFVVVGFG